MTETKWDGPPWIPMSRPIDIKHAGKLLEELGEANEVLANTSQAVGKAIAALSRCVIQGLKGQEPVTHKVNREWLEDELADVMANIELCAEHFGLRQRRMFIRGTAKKKRLKAWHNQLEKKPDEH